MRVCYLYWRGMKSLNTSRLDGQILGHLVVVERVEDVVRPNGKRRPNYKCLCVCGKLVLKESQRLRSDTFPHCGCKTHENLSKGIRKEKSESKSKWEAYSSYAHMIGRCYNPKEKGYRDYGGRGIIVCQRWLESFWNFLEDMGERPKGHVIDRINPNKNYCLENCRWANRSLSSFNTRKAKNNTSGRTGVYWFKRVNKWIASIMVNDTQIHLGYFKNFQDAVNAREAAEVMHYGELKIG